jgi:hypothetical protein
VGHLDRTPVPIRIPCIGDGREVSNSSRLAGGLAFSGRSGLLASDVAVRAGGLVGGWCTRPTARSGCTAHGAEARPSAPVVDASPLADAHARPSRKLADQPKEGPVGSN